ncbi:hypothetical protein [Paraburkholderia sp. GAS42]|jgi:hypothetical protein|uniref:hypothetical protein n=1 Tax=Paraburkholderia sp. GAS42 TaxID=3035135 RepID=UPI003D1C2725
MQTRPKERAASTIVSTEQAQEATGNLSPDALAREENVVVAAIWPEWICREPIWQRRDFSASEAA